MICNPPVIGTIPADTSLPGLLAAFDGQFFGPASYRSTGRSTIFVSGSPTDLYQCYMAAAKASALQMIVERNARRKLQRRPALIPMSARFNWNPPVSQQTATLYQWWDNSEDFWWNGSQHWCQGSLGADSSTAPLALIPNASDYVKACDGLWYYEGDYALSLRQMILDDLAEQNGQIMQPLHSPDGVTPYPPDRLAEVKLAEAYKGLQAQEEAALQLLAQTQSASTVAEISTKETVTDPIGRLVTGVLTQQYTGGQPSQIGPSSSPQTPGGATVQTVVASQPTSAAQPAAAPPAKTNTLLLGALAAAGLFFFNKK